MNHPFSNRKKATIAIALITIIAVSSGIYLQNNSTTQAALINPHPGLAGWWSFDEGIGTVASDSSGNGNTGTIYGATWVSGTYGQALSFGGASDYVQVPDSTSLRDAGNSNRTIEFWAKFTTLSTTPNIQMIGLFETNTIGNRLFLYGNRDNFWTSFRTATSVQDYAANINFAEVLNGWHHFALVYDGAHVYIYLDGNLRNSGVLTGNWANVPVIFKVDANPLAFAGAIDEVRIYNKALSTTDIQADFNSGPDFSANVLAKVPQGTTQVITTFSWQGTGNINVTIVSPSQNYTESILPEYQKSSYSTSNGITSMLNIKRLSVSVTALPSDQNWYMVLALDNVKDYQITVEVQK
jgi:hypothetical protein